MNASRYERGEDRYPKMTPAEKDGAWTAIRVHMNQDGEIKQLYSPSVEGQTMNVGPSLRYFAR